MYAAEDIRKRDNHGFSPMHTACISGHLLVSEWLFEAGAAEDIRTPDNLGCTPMHTACRDGHLSVCKWLFIVALPMILERPIDVAVRQCIVRLKMDIY